MARARRFYWLWSVALPSLVGVVVYFLAANFTDADVMILSLGFAAGAADVVFLLSWPIFQVRIVRQSGS